MKNIIRKFLSVIFRRPYQSLVVKNPCLYQHKFDNMATKCNLGFLSESEFLRYYARSIEFAGRDYRFYLRVHQAIWCASVASSCDGDFVELGTGRGYVFAAVSEYMKAAGIEKRVYLFDTFLPYKTNKKTGEQKEVQKKSEFYADSFEAVKERFSEFGFVNVIKGKCPDSLIEIYNAAERKISFLHVDLNYHQVEIDSLEFLWPKLSSGAVILLDDYANPGREVQHEAHSRYFRNKGLSILTTATGQGIVISR